jgi:hypothetical protein
LKAGPAEIDPVDSSRIRVMSQRAPKSPVLAAISISAAVAVGSIISTLDMATVEDVATGKILTRPLAEAQQRHTLAIATLENTVVAITRDIDFVASRVSTTIRRGEDQTFDRFAQLDAEIVALKDQIAGIQHARFAPARAPEPQRDASADVTGLRSSLHDLSLAHGSAVAAITRRLDRIEMKVGLTTDVIASVSAAFAQKATRARQARKHSVPNDVDAAQSVARPDRGHIFNLKPISQQGAPLRLSKLPG